ncbi:MAG: S-layer homology domain-containing protein [Clostridiales Family XIII bacterium]|jgi:uncharacterized repeat protein (TIGR02543 family)|nr:S-layer homology domain-containing protein [Clostridiales Family XIII bacterium]
MFKQKLSRRLAATMLAATLAFGLAPAGAWATGPVTVGTLAEFKAALADSNVSEIELTGTIEVDESIAAGTVSGPKKVYKAASAHQDAPHLHFKGAVAVADLTGVTVESNGVDGGGVRIDPVGVTLKGLTIKGLTTPNSWPLYVAQQGGSDETRLENVKVLDCVANKGTGGVVKNDSDSKFTLVGCEVSGNTINGTGAGNSAVFSYSEIDIQNSTIANNVANAPAYAAGVIANKGGSISGSTITGNSAKRGYAGGILVTGGDMTVRGTVFSGNVANSVGAGAVYVVGQYSLDVDGTVKFAPEDTIAVSKSGDGKLMPVKAQCAQGGLKPGPYPAAGADETSHSLGRYLEAGYQISQWKAEVNGAEVASGGASPAVIDFASIYGANKPAQNSQRLALTITCAAVSYNISYAGLGLGTDNSANPLTYTVEDEIDLKPPTRAGYSFVGWEPEGRIAKGSTGDRTFTAIWRSKGGPIINTSGGGSSSPSQTTAGAVDVAEEEPPLSGLPWPAFDDVKEGDWFYDDVRSVYQDGYMNGTGARIFEPNSPLTRAMMVTILGRIQGVSPAAFTDVPYTDLDPNAYYAPYVDWGAKNGVVTGYTAEIFKPDQIVSRQEMAAMIGRYLGLVKRDPAAAREYAEFADEETIHAYARPHVQKLYRAELVQGRENNMFAPHEKATRAEAAAIIHRLMGTPEA